jgi:predicted nucleotidyltransferase
LLDISQRRELSLHAEVAAEVTTALAAAGVPGLVVGAFARDMHLHYGAGIPIQRGTQDIDFAFAVNDWTEFEALRTQLIGSKKFGPVEGKQHRLTHTNNIKIDLVPFGGIESTDRTIAWPPNGDTVMDVYGFQEAFKSADQVLLPGDIKLPIVCLPGLALLKIVAWEDRHSRFPGKDAADLNLILRNYLAISVNQQRLWSHFIEWTESPDFDYEHSGARMLGHDIRRLMDDQRRGKIEGILKAQLNQNGPGGLPQEMDRRSPKQAFALLQSLYSGLHSSIRH